LQKTIYDLRYVEIVARIRASRERRGMSQAQLATALGKPQSYIGKVETCERRIDLIETLEICGELDLTLAEILPQSLRHLLTRATPVSND
jgi:transcriptional regulator with XRE-family HTH domain